MPADHALLGRVIREARLDLGLNGADVARRAGISPAHYSVIEAAKPDRRGRYTSPSVPTLRAIADVLGLSRAELLTIAGREADAVWDRLDEDRAKLAELPTEEPTEGDLLSVVADVVAQLSRRRQAEAAAGPDAPLTPLSWPRALSSSGRAGRRRPRTGSQGNGPHRD